MNYIQGVQNLSDLICIRLKNIYYPDEKWCKKVAMEVAAKLMMIKIVARKFYNIKNTDDAELFKILSEYPERALKETLEDATETINGKEANDVREKAEAYTGLLGGL